MAKRKVEIFSAECALCEDAVKVVNDLACDTCDVIVLNMREKDVAEKAKRYGVKCVPAVAVDGELLDCCKRCEPCSEDNLKAAGVGQPV